MPHHLVSQIKFPTQNLRPHDACVVPQTVELSGILVRKVAAMSELFCKLARDEAGLIVSAEMIVILTVTVLGMVVGLSNLQTAITGEFADLSLAFQSLNQSYRTPSFYGCWKFWGPTSWFGGSAFYDIFDGCVGGTVVGQSQSYSSNCEIVSTSSCTTGNCPAETQTVTPSATGTTETKPALDPVPHQAAPPADCPTCR